MITATPPQRWRSVAGVAIGGVAIVIAALLGIGAIKSEGNTNGRGGPGGFVGGPPGQQFPFPGPGGPSGGPGGQFQPPQGQVPQPPMPS